jgi:hypothetical protein
MTHSNRESRVVSNTEAENFDAAMDKLLKADPAKVRAAMEAEKEARAGKRKAKKSSASGRASRAKD